MQRIGYLQWMMKFEYFEFIFENHRLQIKEEEVTKSKISSPN